MATYTDGTFPNLIDWAKRQDPDGKGVAKIVDVLSRKLPLLEDVPWKEGNLTTGHRITRTSNSLPSGTWRQINAGITPVKGSTDQYDETVGMLEAESVVDRDLAKLNGDEVAFRKSEDDMIVEGISQQFATAMFYESVATNPERIHGLSPRYPATSGYDTSSYCIRPGAVAQSGGTADNRSIWLINWEPGRVYGIFPKGSQMGLIKEDKGEVRVTDPNDSTKFLWAWITHFQWKLGLAVEDYRYCVRCQWDPSDTTTFPVAGTGKALTLALQDMINTIYDSSSPNLRFYMDRTSKARIDRELAAVGESSLLQYLSEGGKRIMTFMGIPIRVTDSLVQESYIA